jgi:uncharacterized protein (TIRG00374 family)
MNAKSHLLLLVQSLVTVVLLALLVNGLDWRAFSTVYARVPLSAYVVSLAVVAFGQALYAWRWFVVLRTGGVQVSYGAVVRQYLIGMFVGNFLPSTVGGDVAKVYLLGRTHGYSAISASVLLDRLLGFGILATLAAVAIVIAHPNATVLTLLRTALLIVVAAALVAVGLTMAGSGGLSLRVSRFWPRARRWGDELRRLRLAMLGGLRHPAVIYHAAMSVLVYFGLLSLVYQALVERLGGVRLGFVETLMVVSSVTVLSHVPISLNGLGVREQLHVVLFDPFGVSKEAAVAISLLLFAHALVISALGGVLWLRAERTSTPTPVPLT